MTNIAKMLRHQARDGNVFDHSNGTVVVTRTLLTDAASEIEQAHDHIRELCDMIAPTLKAEMRLTQGLSAARLGALRYLDELDPAEKSQTVSHEKSHGDEKNGCERS